MAKAHCLDPKFIFVAWLEREDRNAHVKALIVMSAQPPRLDSLYNDQWTFLPDVEVVVFIAAKSKLRDRHVAAIVLLVRLSNVLRFRLVEGVVINHFENPGIGHKPYARLRFDLGWAELGTNQMAQETFNNLSTEGSRGRYSFLGTRSLKRLLHGPEGKRAFSSSSQIASFLKVPTMPWSFYAEGRSP
jgi:hypothetical protein